MEVYDQCSFAGLPRLPIAFLTITMETAAMLLEQQFGQGRDL